MFVGLFANSLGKPIPCEVRPQEVGLCESLKLGHTESSCRIRTMLFPLGEQGLGTGVWAQGECYSHQDGVVERPSCHVAALVKLRGQSPPWARAEVETGAHAHCLQRAELGCLTEAPGGKGWKQRGSGPTGTVQHTFLQNQLLSFSLLSLEASITCNNLELIYIKTIKYDLRYKLTSTRPHIT